MSSLASELDEFCKQELLALARRALECHLSSRRMPAYETNNPGLLTVSAAFVTLRNGPQLRGCIGHLSPDVPLYRTVQRCAVSAAVEDFRFASVRLEELREITIEISILSGFTRVCDPNEIEVGKHGLVITFAGRRGLLLPQVAAENFWDRTAFLEQTCRKANLPDGAWKRKGVVLETFTAQVFSESALAHAAV